MSRKALAISLAGVVILVLSLWAVGAGVESAADSHGGAFFDTPIARWAVEHASGLKSTMRIVTWLGAAAIVLPILLVTALAIRRRPGAERIRIFLILAAIGLLLSNLIKLLVDRPRPAIGPLVAHTGTAFPSGHTTAAAILFGALAYVLGRDGSRGLRIILWSAAGALTLLVGASRVILGVHWTTDVIGGVVLGSGWIATAAVAAGILEADRP